MTQRILSRLESDAADQRAIQFIKASDLPSEGWINVLTDPEDEPWIRRNTPQGRQCCPLGYLVIQAGGDESEIEIRLPGTDTAKRWLGIDEVVAGLIADAADSAIPFSFDVRDALYAKCGW